MLEIDPTKFPFDRGAGGAFSFIVEEGDMVFALPAGEVELVVCRAIVIVAFECFFDDVLGFDVEGECLPGICP